MPMLCLLPGAIHHNHHHHLRTMSHNHAPLHCHFHSQTPVPEYHSAPRSSCWCVASRLVAIRYTIKAQHRPQLLPHEPTELWPHSSTHHERTQLIVLNETIHLLSQKTRQYDPYRLCYLMITAAAGDHPSIHPHQRHPGSIYYKIQLPNWLAICSTRESIDTLGIGIKT